MWMGVNVSINACPVFWGGEELWALFVRINVIVLRSVPIGDPSEVGNVPICPSSPRYLGVSEDACICVVGESVDGLLLGAAWFDASIV